MLTGVGTSLASQLRQAQRPYVALVGPPSTVGVYDAAMIQAAIDSLPRGGVVRLQGGTYSLGTVGLSIVVDGITLEGAGGHTAGGLASKPTTIDATLIASGGDAITALGPNPGNTMKGVRFKDFYLQMLGAGVGGAGIKCWNCSLVDVDHVSVYAARGATSYGIQFGDLATPARAVIASTIRGCTVVSDGTPILIGAGSTSVALEHNYALGQSTAGVVFAGCTYCTAHACAADSGTASGYGYSFTQATGITLTGCGAENNGKAFARLFATREITFIGCRGVGNNTSADNAIGSLLELAASVSINTQVIGCTDTAATVTAPQAPAIHGGAGVLDTLVIGYFAGVSGNLPNGIAGDATWLSSYLSLLSGEGFTPPPASYVFTQRLAAAAAPAWSAALTGLTFWDTTNNRLCVYGTAARHYFTPTGVF